MSQRLSVTCNSSSLATYDVGSRHAKTIEFGGKGGTTTRYRQVRLARLPDASARKSRYEIAGSPGWRGSASFGELLGVTRVPSYRRYVGGRSLRLRTLGREGGERAAALREMEHSLWQRKYSSLSCAVGSRPPLLPWPQQLPSFVSFSVCVPSTEVSCLLSSRLRCQQ